MSTDLDRTPASLDEIAQRKQAVLSDIRQSSQHMSALSRGLLAPLQPTTSTAGNLKRTINTGMAMVDGFFFGLKMLRIVRRLFRK